MSHAFGGGTDPVLPALSAARPSGAEVGHLVTVTCDRCGLQYDTEEGARAKPAHALPRRARAIGFSEERDGDRLTLRIPESRGAAIVMLVGFAILAAIGVWVTSIGSGILTAIVLVPVTPFALGLLYLGLAFLLDDVVITLDSTTLHVTDRPLPTRSAIHRNVDRIDGVGLAAKGRKDLARYVVIVTSRVGDEVRRDELVDRHAFDPAEAIAQVLIRHFEQLGHPVTVIEPAP